MSRTRITMFLGLVLIGSVLIGWSLYADEPKAQEPMPGDFSGKIVVMNMKSNADFGAILESPQIRRISGRDYFVGKQVDDGRTEDWSKGLKCWVAVDDVAFMTEVDSVDDLKKRMESLDQ